MTSLLKTGLLALITATLASAGSGLGPNDALAADRPTRRSLPPAPELPKFHSWTGVYVGGQIGYGWGSGSRIFGPAGSRQTSDAVVGGAHAGFDYQAGSVVAGIAGDLEAVGQDGGPAGVTRDWQASVRGRIGYAFDTLMIYGTGGAAFTRFGSAPTALFAGTEVARTGWTAGGGIAYAFSDHIVASLEYRYIDFGRFDPSGGASGPAFVQDARLHTARAALSYRF